MSRNRRRLILRIGLLLVVVWLSVIIGLLTRDNQEALIQPPAEQTGNTVAPQAPTTGTVATDQEEEQKEVLLNIALPVRMLSPGLKEQAIKYEKQNPGTTINFVTGASHDDYLDMTAKGLEDKTIHAALIASENVVSYLHHAYTLKPRESIQAFYHPMFDTTFSQGETQYIPHAIDPQVVIGAYKKNQQTEFQDIFALADTYPGGQLLFGYDAATLELLKVKQEPYPGYFQSLYQLIGFWYNTNNINHTKRFIDLQKKLDRSIIEWRKQLIDKQKRAENCPAYTHICFLSFGLGQAGLGFLSDMVIRDKLFAKSPIVSDNMKLFNYPTSKPMARGRGRVINKDTDELIGSIGFISSLIGESIGGNVRLLPNKMLSAYNNLFDLQLTQAEYQYIKQNRDKREMIYGSRDRQSFFTNKTSINDVLGGAFNIELYFTNPNWTF